MKVFFYKEIQAYEYVTFSKLKMDEKTNFCCDKFRNYDSLMKAWDSKTGKFCLVEKDTLIPIDYCPFCGERIEYIQVE